MRLYAAHGLLAGRDEEGLKTLVGLLTEPTPEWAWHAEELLRWVGGKSAPREVIGNPGRGRGTSLSSKLGEMVAEPSGADRFPPVGRGPNPAGVATVVDRPPPPPLEKRGRAIYHPKPPRICLFGFDGKLRHAFG